MNPIFLELMSALGVMSRHHCDLLGWSILDGGARLWRPLKASRPAQKLASTSPVNIP